MNNKIQLTEESYKDNPVLRYNGDKYYIIPNFNQYAISKAGEILNIKRDSTVSTYVGIDNYEHCTLHKKGKKYRKRVHRIMGKVFLGNPPVINHKDGDKSHNHLDNLERSSHQENIQHAYNNGYYQSTYKVVIRCTCKKTNESVVCRSMREAQRYTGVDRHRIKTFLNNTRPNYTNWIFAIV